MKKLFMTMALVAAVFAMGSCEKGNDNGVDDPSTSKTPTIKFNDNVFEISDAEGFKAFADLVNGVVNTTASVDWGSGTIKGFSTTPQLNINAKLMCDIDLEEAGICGPSINGGTSWTPIGTSVNNDDRPYSGTFDGNSKTISNLYINSTEQCQGLFGAIKNGTVTSLKLTDVDITSTEGSVGGISGTLSEGDGHISHCQVSGEVNGQTSVGGIVGWSGHTSKIEFCKSSVNVTATDLFAGGIVGNTYKSRIISSYNSGNINARLNAGGIVGYVNGQTAVVSCINIGLVEGSNSGGIAGSMSAYSNIAACYNTGTVDEEGILGNLEDSSATVSNCFSTAAITNDVGTKVANIAELNTKVTDLNGAINTWNNEHADIISNCHFVAGGNDVTPPSLSTGTID